MKLKKFWGPLHLNLNHFFCAQKSRFFREQKSQSSMRTSCTTLPGRAASTQAHEGRNQWFQQRPRITDHGQHASARGAEPVVPTEAPHQGPRRRLLKKFDKGIGDRRECQKIARGHRPRALFVRASTPILLSQNFKISKIATSKNKNDPRTPFLNYGRLHN